MTTIQLHLSDELAGKIQSITSNTEAFIVDLLSSKLNELNMPALLAEEYFLASKENIPLMKEFANTDMEGWDDNY